MDEIIDDEDVHEISFERLENGTWQRIEEDPNDDESEITKHVGQAYNAHAQIKKLLQQGWTVEKDVEPDFKGILLTKPRRIDE